MKIPEEEIEKAKARFEDYKIRVANGEHFTTWEEVKSSLPPDELAEIEKETKKMLAKVEKRKARMAKKEARKAKKEQLGKYVKA